VLFLDQHLAEHRPARLQHLTPNVVVEVAEVSSELVEHRGQPERNLRVLETGVLSLRRLVTQPDSSLGDQLLVAAKV
jgi:hypothetical protein